MTDKANRRDDLLVAALDAFVERGYEGTSIADLAVATGLSKAAFVYHFASKEALLVELAEPLLDELDAVVDRHESHDDIDVRALLADYLDALCRGRPVAEWIDGDKSVLNHGALGGRLDRNNRRFHRLLLGRTPSRRDRTLGSAVLGMLWRPVRNQHLSDDPDARSELVDLAAAATAATR